MYSNTIATKKSANHGVTTRSMSRNNNGQKSSNNNTNVNDDIERNNTDGDNEAMCYAFKYIMDEQAHGRYCKYKSKDWDWDVITDDTWKEIMHRGNNDKEGEHAKKITNEINEDNEDSSCDEHVDCSKDDTRGYRSHGFQVVRVICKRELFTSIDERYKFIERLEFQMRHNIEGKGSFGWRLHFGGETKYGQDFTIEYHSDSKVRIYNILAMLFAYRQHVKIQYKIELWEQEYNYVGYAEK
jgi:hypothetical protein